MSDADLVTQAPDASPAVPGAARHDAASRAESAETPQLAPLMRACVCMPTYNERENVEPMLRALAAVLGPDDRVLVIDDSSPDGTGELADRLAQELAFVSVLHRPGKQGLGRAYLDGFRWALDEGAEMVLEMDCDFSHDPKDVPRLIAAVEEGADLAIGSRYVRGGGTRNWGFVRRLISRGGSLYTRALLMPIHDPTAGFKCYRRAVLETIDLGAIRSAGYAFQIETSYRAIRKGFGVQEVPVVFVDRTEGQSKMSRAIFLEAVVRVPALRVKALAGRL